MNNIILVQDFIKTLKSITDFSILKKGDKIFNRCSLSVEYVDTFDHIEHLDNKEIIFYYNCKGEFWHGKTDDYWYYYEE